MDAARQDQQAAWTLRDWAAYFSQKDAASHKVLNVLSLEVSGTRLGERVLGPKFVRDLDWIPAAPAACRAKVQKYCLMSAAGSFTDWHVDMGGSSVWYLRRADILWTDRGDAVATTWMVRGDEAATPQPRRGLSVESRRRRRGHSRGDELRRRRGRDVG